ncbi:MAG: endonuclease III [Candidatus Aenigmarchaeota archaeon]|nr:endonuclease III [Candidatus Aenigmarchaeota archaeon]
MDRKEKMDIVINLFRKRYSNEIEKHPNNYNKDPFRVLISTILSQRTREENTAKATDALFSAIKTPKELLNLNIKKIEELIKPSGFYRQKAKTIKKVAEILVNNYQGRVPGKRATLITLPGVGLKTADVVLSHSFSVPTIAIDTHVNTISKRLGLTPEGADYETIRIALESLTPLPERSLVNLGFVFFGREICLTSYPKCKTCPLKNICRYYKH